MTTPTARIARPRRAYDLGMRRLLPGLALLAIVPVSAAAGVVQPIRGNGVVVAAPSSWRAVHYLGEDRRADPHTVLVVGTKGVRPSLTSGCQIAAYRIPATGAVIIVVRWRTLTSGGGQPVRGRAPLKALTRVRRPSFECFTGRGAAAQLALGNHAYQVNVMVGDHATARTVSQALAIARSFDLAH
jgi:hypothetical protein